MFLRAPLLATGLVSLAIVVGASARGAAPHPALAGVWNLDRPHSTIPADIAFDVPASLLGAASSPQAGGGRGRGGSGGGGGNGSGGVTGSMSPIFETQDDVKRRRQLIAELKEPPATLTITETNTAVTVSGPDDYRRTFHLNGQEDIQPLKDVPAVTHTKWIGMKLEVNYSVEKDRVLRYDYSRSGDGAAATLKIEASPRDHGKGDVITLVYTAARAAGANGG